MHFKEDAGVYGLDNEGVDYSTLSTTCDVETLARMMNPLLETICNIEQSLLVVAACAIGGCKAREIECEWVNYFAKRFYLYYYLINIFP